MWPRGDGHFRASDGFIIGVMADDFFESKSIEQLIAEQGVSPVTDLTALEGLFEDDDEVDEFLSSLRS